MGACVGVLLLGGAAMGYQAWYKSHVLSKMEKAFEGGYDPVLALARGGDQLAHAEVLPLRDEEALVRRIVEGKEPGRYFLILGSKGSGKTSTLIDAMARNQAEGCAFFDAHQTPEIVVDRFSESINYSMNRDYLGNLLGLSDLSGMTHYQSLERALHKLEKAVQRYAARTGRPAVIIMNSAHLLPRDDDGVKLLQLFQQRAEKWASAGCATFVFTSNDYWVFDTLRKNSNRMDTLTFKDLTRPQSMRVLEQCRVQYYGRERFERDAADDDLLEEVYQTVGGRIALLNKIARREDMRAAVRQLVVDDLNWLLSKTGIIEDHDDDVMDEQKWSTCSWLLFVELAKRQKALEEESASALSASIAARREDEQVRQAAHESEKEQEHGEKRPQDDATNPLSDVEVGLPGDVPNPSLTWGEVRQVMTRPDFLEELDRLNIIHVDRHHHIRADSMPLLRAFRLQAEEEGYEDKLESVMDRVSAIESLLRTRELVWKEQGHHGKFMVRQDSKGRELEAWRLLGGDDRLNREEEQSAGME
ncbi:hypothetical protein FA09DRAFT_299005 [Tilletiopsis washingtonensis]|uniref:AAA protein C-terminal winged helix domain-containing protein n=1 Tax=Tilletiopsis washingtonensis TaxID=58919 RepID=A0A316Z687_9BASI|nr:hypothetical protein FA09DRAFT_299005 [Tilletiopsis washingtonensis]PWN97081.1 hypothetical protein FA09DRAFT_299005 [Tilletiopsis washingtonensis]